MKTHNYSQIEQITQNPQFYEAEEGGINLSSIKETIFRKIGIIAGITAAVSSVALFQALSRTPTYHSGFEILSEPVTIETKVTSSGSQSRETREEITAVKLDEVQLKSLKSLELINPIVNKLKSKYPTISYQDIAGKLELTTNEERTLLQVAYKHSDSQQVKDVLQAIAIRYLDYSLDKRRIGVNRGLEFLDQQIPKIQATIDQLHQQLQQLREEYNFIEPNLQGQQLSARLDGLVEQELQLKSKLDQAQWMAGVVKKELSEQATTSTAASQAGTPRYNQLIDHLREIDTQIAEKSAIFSPQSLEIQTLQEQRQELVSLLDREGEIVQQKVNNQIRSLQEQDRVMKEKIEGLQQQLKEWSGVTRDYEDIERRMKVTVEQFNELLIQREALRIEAAQKEAPWRLLTPVEEPQPDSASTVNYVVLGTALGLLLGMGAAIILDKYQDLIYTSGQVKEITNLPIMGIIPFDRFQKKLSFSQNVMNLIEPSESKQSAIEIYSRDFLANNLLSSSIEAFRFFGANLGLFEPNNTIRSFIITSAISGEGKSTVALNLARAAANIGRRVLVVDTDMRSPNNISAIMTLNQNVGLSNLLLNKNLDFQDVVQKSFLEKDLFILPTGNGNTIPNSSRLLASQEMRDLIEKLKNHFDLVIYDVSSILAYADASLLATKTDGIVLVTGLGKLQSLKLKEAINQLNISNTPVLGIVVNQMT
jgi:capsular exopolysaccharide synthesis family protein